MLPHFQSAALIEIFSEEPGCRAIKAGTAVLPVTLIGGFFQGDACLGKPFNKLLSDGNLAEEATLPPTLSFSRLLWILLMTDNQPQTHRQRKKLNGL